MHNDYRVIDPRDWRVRVALLLALGVLAALCWALSLTIRQHVATLQAVAATDPGDAARRAASSLRTLFTLMAGGNVAVAAYLAWQGVRVIASGQVPPPGSWVFKGRRVYAGRFAPRIGRLFLALAVLLLGASVGLLWLVWRLTAP
jgi:hypothetical protein